MTEGLFHIGADGELASMRVAPFHAEEVLQSLLVDHPDLLAGGQMNPQEPRRWALIQRERGVPDRADAGARWSVDHLFVDQDAVPTLVEVKRSTDTRIRREVVGQMLDYAANGVRYWPVADLRADFVANQQSFGLDPDRVIVDLCQDAEITADAFFARVADNLRSGRIRMVFVADIVPDELRRITEFLNEQMSPAEVFAVEVKQYRADGYEGLVIVPAVYGRTAAASIKSGGSRKPPPDRDEAMALAQESTREMVSRIIELAGDHDLVVHESPAGALLKTRGHASLANVYLAGFDTLEVPLQPLRDRGCAAQAEELLVSLQAMTTKPLTSKAPSLPTQDALANWPLLRDLLLRVLRLYEQSPGAGGWSRSSAMR